jgi:hypothetical protein
MAPEFKMAGKNYFWSSIHKCVLFSKRVHALVFPQYDGTFIKDFFFIESKMAESNGKIQYRVFDILK